MTKKYYNNDFIQVHRISRNLMDRLSQGKDEIGSVMKMWPNGFLTVDETDRPIYFFSSRQLHVPFGIGLKGSVTKWLMKTGASMGDQLIFQDGNIYFPFAPHIPIEVSPGKIVDLKRQWPDRIPSIREQNIWIKIIVEEIFQHGCLDGLGEVVKILNTKNNRVSIKNYFNPGTLPGSACGCIHQLKLSTVKRDIDGVTIAFKGLVGLGPGLTPSGDDFLVGFFAAHQIFASTLIDKICLGRSKKELISHARASTTHVSAELIACALDGYFSEMVYDVIQSLTAIEKGQNTHKAIRSLLGWGNTSGTDTLVGLAFGLKSLNSKVLS